ncbi:MAG: L-threonylcarbamoyladenylate synthase [Saezia sp.]
MTLSIFSATDFNHIQQAAQALKGGKLVVLPTETVYGLGADADQDMACRAVFETKARPADHPLIVHVSSQEAALHYAQNIPAFAQNLINTFWPGPLTIIVKRKESVGAAAAGGQDSIGLRCPSHPVAQALMKAFEAIGGYGIAAPSANLFGSTSPTTAQHVQKAFADVPNHSIAMILDGGACDVGIESTIIDCSRGKPVLLRPGTLTLEELEKAAKTKIYFPKGDQKDETAPKASGTLVAHYAPKAKVRLMNAENMAIALGLVAGVKTTSNDPHIGVYARTMPSSGNKTTIKRQMPNDAKAVAHELFAVLHDFDAQGVKLLWIEELPDAEEWDGVRDRLQRAAAASA